MFAAAAAFSRMSFSGLVVVFRPPPLPPFPRTNFFHRSHLYRWHGERNIPRVLFCLFCCSKKKAFFPVLREAKVSPAIKKGAVMKLRHFPLLRMVFESRSHSATEYRGKSSLYKSISLSLSILILYSEEGGRWVRH